jgi:hypothetical protein
MRRFARVLPAVTALSLYAANAYSATSGTPLDQVYTSATTMISGPMAGLVILFGALAVAVFFMFAAPNFSASAAECDISRRIPAATDAACAGPRTSGTSAT